MLASAIPISARRQCIPIAARGCVTSVGLEAHVWLPCRRSFFFYQAWKAVVSP